MHIYNNVGKKIPIKSIIIITLFIIAIIILIFCSGEIKNTSKEEQQKHIENVINRAVTSCYSTEGKYPKDIEYLKNHYGLLINEDKYLIIYDSFANNIRPRIKIVLREDFN